MKFNVEDYLKRIGFSEKPDVSLDTLNKLHQSHLFCIPFENLDVINKRKIVLKKEDLFDKIVNKKRGGFCYELNGLFYYLLQSIGFYVTRVSVRVFNNDGIPGIDFGHLALIVKLHKDYLVDVGFGDNFLKPMEMENDIIQKDPTGYFCIQQYDQKHFVLKRSYDKINFERKYIFTTKPREFEEFEDACEYTVSSQDSHFTQNTVVSIPVESGRITLNKNKLTITEKDEKTITPFKNEAEFESHLIKHFGMKSKH